MENDKFIKALKEHINEAKKWDGKNRSKDFAEGYKRAYEQIYKLYLQHQ